MTALQAMLFDLDGTLLDTAPDLINTLNILLTEIGRDNVSYEYARPYVSAGANALIKAGLGKNTSDEVAERHRARFLEIYLENISKQSALFEGMEEVLETLEKRGIAWGIVTNKPAFLTEPLLKALKLTTRCCAIISADTTPNKKPHPGPIIEACKRCNINASNCLYVGDDRRDIEAGNSAGMQTLAAAWGYYLAHDDPNTWQATAVISSPLELLAWL
jgi:phosphoglycolate phosphatase